MEGICRSGERDRVEQNMCTKLMVEMNNNFTLYPIYIFCLEQNITIILCLNCLLLFGVPNRQQSIAECLAYMSVHVFNGDITSC